MSDQQIDITTTDGNAPCHFFSPPHPQPGPRPAIILYMDAFGIRPALCGMAQRMADAGYYVLLPDLYYRSAPPRSFNPATAFQQEPERTQLTALYRSLSVPLVMADTEHFLSFLQRDPRTAGQKVGTVGYCMGGGFALSAAGYFPKKIAAAASFHGARLATDAPDSPHLLAPKIKAALYVGIAGLDPHFPPEETQRLEAALTSAGVRHQVEVYPGAKHGFAVADHSVYDPAAAERHWEKLLQLFAENL